MSYRLLSITWFLDSPFGTYSAGDYIEVWWNESTSSFDVFLNASPVTSGDDIPFQSWSYAGLPDTDYKEEEVYQVSLCSGTTLLTFNRAALFPYLQKVELSGHPSCVVVDPDNPLVCDLAFSTILPSSTPASSSTALDGSITATATSSNGAVKYKLNDDFINGYNDPSAQVSGTFTGLGPGIYQVFARDENNCLAVQTIEVMTGDSSDYGTHYQLEFYNPAGHQVKAEILERDYSDAIVDTICGETGSPLIFQSRAEGEKDKFVSVIATTMTFRLASTVNNEYVSLYTNDQEKYRLKVSIDSGVGYETMWLGKVVINQYEENYKSPPYGIKIVASDALPGLKDIPFADATGGQLRGTYSCIKLISWLLLKTGLSRNIRVAVNMYAAEMNSTASDDPLDQAYVDVLRYYLFRDTPSCMDVLKMILESFGAQIIHYYGFWNITRVEEKVDAYDYREFDENGDYVTSGNYDPVRLVQVKGSANSLHWANSDQIMDIQPGFGSIQLISDLGKKPNLLFNGDFAVRKYSYFGWGAVSSDVTGAITFGFSQYEGTIADTTGFEVVTNGNVVQRFIENIDNENVALGFRASSSGSYLQSETLNLKLGNVDILRVTYVFRIAPFSINNSYKSFQYYKIKIKVIYGDYYLLNDGTWTTTDSTVTYYVKASDADKWQTLTILADAPDTAYYLGQNIQVLMYFPIANDPDHTSIATLKAVDTTPGGPGTTLGEGYKTEWYDSVSGYTGIYELTRTTDVADDLNIIEPDDYEDIGNPYQWVATGFLFGPPGGEIQINIDKIALEVLNLGRELPENASFTGSMENDNKLILNKIIYHGSLNSTGQTILNFGVTSLPVNIFIGGNATPVSFFYSQSYYGTVSYSAESGDIAFCGYFRDSSGSPFTVWTRDNIAEERKIEEIFIVMYTAQYNKPWQRITGSLVSHEILLSPIDSINDLTGGGDKTYYPPSLTIDYALNQYRGEFLELSDATNADGANAPAEFNLDFNLDFTS